MKITHEFRVLTVEYVHLWIQLGFKMHEAKKKALSIIPIGKSTLDAWLCVTQLPIGNKSNR